MYPFEDFRCRIKSKKNLNGLKRQGIAMRNHEVTEKQNLLTCDGIISEEGWARRPVWKYDRKDIKAGALKIKEWEYYAVTSLENKYTICATISDLGYAGLMAVAFIDFKRKACAQADAMTILPLGKMGMKPSSDDDGSLCFENKDIVLRFEKRGNQRFLKIAAPKMVLPDGTVGLDADLQLSQPKSLESMNIATSWAENRKAFYLNQKINCMATNGTVNGVSLKKDDVWSVLDWGRGRWTYKNTWYWGSGNGFVDGHSFGFNIGYGFTDRTPASENVIFYDGKIHKLDDVFFNIPEDDFLKPWTFTSSDKRFEMNFKPAVDRTSVMNFKVIESNQHQVFGFFTGKAVLDDGTVINIKDFPAFAEKVYNKY